MFNGIKNKIIILFIVISFLLLISPVVFANQTVDNNIFTGDNSLSDDNLISDDNSLCSDNIGTDDNEFHKETSNSKQDGNDKIYVSPSGGGSGVSPTETTNIEDAVSRLDDNGTIYLTADGDNNQYQLYGVGINPTVLKNTTKNVKIVGDSKSNISLRSTYLMFDIGEVNLTFRNLNFIDSYSYYYLGVIISQVSNVSFINCSFINYRGFNKDTSFIYSVYSNMTFTNCTFKDSNLSNGSSFIRSYVRRVMGEYMNDFPIQYYSYSNMLFKNNLFVNNTASCDSNLLFFDCCDCIELRNNRFENNTAINGLVRSYLGFNDSFINNTFINNEANCLFLAYSNGLVKSNVFKNNTSPMATGILMINGEYNLSNNEFINNHADNYGGAIVNLGYYQVNMTKCVFNNNSALYGGAIYNVYDSLNITYSNFTSNKAAVGGALYYMFNDTKITSMAFNPNIELNNPNAIKNSLFESNTADEGSVLYALRSNIQFNENAIFNRDVNDNLITVKENASINIDNNWWGQNNPNYGVITNGLIPKTWIIMNLTNTTTSTNPINLKVSLNTLNNQKEFKGNIPQRIVKFTAKDGVFNINQSSINKTLTNTYTGTSPVYAAIDNEKIRLNSKDEVWMSVDNIKTKSNRTITIKINTVNDLKNNVTIYVNDKLIKNTKVNGTFNLDYFISNSYKTANYTIKVSYNGDSKYMAKNVTANLEVLNTLSNNINNVITPLVTKNTNYTTELPAKYDPRLTNSTTPLTNQGNSGSCWVFSSINTLQECIKKQVNQTYDFSENNAKNIIAKYSLIGDNEKTPNNGGSGIEVLSYMVGWYGPLLEETEGYSDFSVISPQYDSSYHVQDVIFVPERKQIMDIDQIKEAVYNYGAVQVIYNGGSISTNLYNNEHYEDNHGATIVGWDDNYDKNNFQFDNGTDTITPEGDGAFIIKNSWGGGFADDGYQYISYYDLTYGGYLDTNGYNIELYAYLINDTPEYTDIYQYDALATQKLQFTGKARMKNTYTADKDETLAAIGTYFVDKSSYSLKVYINNELVHTQTANVTQRGYRTIKLDKYYLLNKNDDFTIEMEIKSLERNVTEIYYQYKENHDEKYAENLSYISYDGDEWLDAYDFLNKGAITLKAYALETPIVNTTAKLVNGTLTIKTGVINNNKNANITYLLNGKALRDSNGNIVNIKITSDATKTSNYAVGNLTEYTLKTIYTSEEYEIEHVTSFVKNNTTLTIKTNNSKPKVNDKIDIILQLQSNSNNLKNQNITVKINNKEYTLLTDNNGKANITIKLQTVGNQKVTASYQGNNTYNPSNSTLTFNVDKISTTTNVSIKNKTVTNTTVEITLADSDNNKAISGASLIVLDGNKKELATTTTDNNGKAVVKINLPSGNQTVTVKYLGNNTYKASNRSITINVQKITPVLITSLNSPVIVGQTVTITATVTDNNKAVNGTVTFKMNNKTIQTLELSKSKAVLNTTTASAGIYNITVIFNANEIYNSVSSNMKLQSNKLNTTLTIAANNTNPRVNDNVKITLTLKDSHGKLLGNENVTLQINNKTYLLTTNKNAIATYTYTLLRNDNAMNIKASFNSTNLYNPSKMSLNINRYYEADMELLTGSFDSKPGDTVKLIAHIRDNGVDIDGGQLVFKLNGVSLKDENGNAVVVNIKKGLAVLEYKIPDTLGARTHSLTAVYASNNYGRVELTTPMTINKYYTHIDVNPLYTTGNSIQVKAQVVDQNNQALNKQTSMCIKL
ncbi:MAG: hypothetical protein BZ137_09615, partial [Methanosphaera sp. rholeuAM130]